MDDLNIIFQYPTFSSKIGYGTKIIIKFNNSIVNIINFNNKYSSLTNSRN